MTTCVDEATSIGWDDPRWLAAGITFRMLDYWTRTEYLTTDGAQCPGSGKLRRWPLAELEVAVRAKRLINVGFSLAAAFEHARRGVGAHELADGIVLEVAA